MDDEHEVLRLKAKFYQMNKVPIHISKRNGWFNNGTIIDVDIDFFLMEDEKEGEIPIFFLEIDEIKKREEKR